MVSHLGIHIIGPRYGESIVLELPDGAIGVIDSFASRGGKHPVLNFLKSKFPDVSTLRFFGLSHPHADHCFRAAEILTEYRPEEVWIFRPFPAGQVQAYYQALWKHKKVDKVEAALELPVGSVAESLLQLHSKIRIPVKQNRKKFDIDHSLDM